eukprot:6987663-Alexandrium_andersonii.AAC.1
MNVVQTIDKIIVQTPCIALAASGSRARHVPGDAHDREGSSLRTTQPLIPEPGSIPPAGGPP